MIRVVDEGSDREFNFTSAHHLSKFIGYSESFIKDKLSKGDWYIPLLQLRIYSPEGNHPVSSSQLSEEVRRRSVWRDIVERGIY